MSYSFRAFLFRLDSRNRGQKLHEPVSRNKIAQLAPVSCILRKDYSTEYELPSEYEGSGGKKATFAAIFEGHGGHRNRRHISEQPSPFISSKFLLNEKSTISSVTVTQCKYCCYVEIQNSFLQKGNRPFPLFRPR